MDWSLLTCARKGHITYAPDEPALRDRLHVATPAGEAWRCLRCGTYVHGEPHGRGPADRAPLVPRGRALRDELIMRFFALERLVRALIIAAAAYGVWRFSAHRGSIQRVFEKDIPLLKPLADQLGWDLDHSHIVETIRHVFVLKSTTLTWFAVGLLAYAVVELVEGIGLWLLQRWGEYFAVLATSFGLPMAGPYMDFCKVDAVEHWPSSGSVTVVVRERARGAAGFDEVATSASTEWEIVPARS